MPRRTPIETASMVMAATLVGIGVLSWAAWALQLRVLLEPFGPLPPTKVNEAVCWVLIGLALLGVHLRLPKSALIAIPAAAIGGLTLAEHVFHLNLHIDQLLSRDFLMVDPDQAGRMSTMSAGCILLSSATML